jgi:hypothetical protein
MKLDICFAIGSLSLQDALNLLPIVAFLTEVALCFQILHTGFRFDRPQINLSSS